MCSGSPFERPSWGVVNPSGRAIEKLRFIDFHSWQEANPLERPHFWRKRSGLTRSVVSVYLCTADTFDLYLRIKVMPSSGRKNVNRQLGGTRLNHSNLESDRQTWIKSSVHTENYVKKSRTFLGLTSTKLIYLEDLFIFIGSNINT